jgi:predicted Zn-dependent peptidase
MDVEAEPPPGGSVRLDWLEPLDPQVILRYRIPGVGHPDRPAFDLIARLLREGSWQASASQNGSPSVLTLQSRAARDEDLPALERAALDLVARVRTGPVDAASLARVKRELRFEWDLVRTDRGSLASQLGGFAVADEWRTLRTYFESRETVTSRDIQALAARYLVPWNQVIATTRRNPQPRAERTAADAPAVQRPGGGR